MPHTFPFKQVTARHPHTCDLCGEPIPVGSPYLSGSTVDGRDWTYHRVHAACETLRLADPDADLAETKGDQHTLWRDYLRGLTPSDIAAILKDHPPTEIARLTALWQRSP